MLYERTNKCRNTTEKGSSRGRVFRTVSLRRLSSRLKYYSRENEARSAKAHTNVNQILSGVSVVATKYQVRLWRIELEMESSTY